MSIEGLRIVGGNGLGNWSQFIGSMSISCTCWVTPMASVMLSWILQLLVGAGLVTGGMCVVAMRWMLGEGGRSQYVA